MLNPVTPSSRRSRRGVRRGLVDLGDVTSSVSAGKDEVPASFMTNDTREWKLKNHGQSLDTFGANIKHFSPKIIILGKTKI